MVKIKRTIASVLSTVMVISMLTACGEKKDEKTDAASGQAVSGEAAAP